ncbi:MULTISPECIES: hypothetical protein [unclassified Methanosarcina]|uniref:hypothetical protein n=1 Tax=unclassified Methanosarcina TaxID=2644672 RepID=UPI000615CCEF|nr:MULTISPECIES: hypothetical protein [unclassified Methanosarcina]AKB16931.1 hypothetical protein MSWHS_0068 [Methanosarcina sp. WWM596]AKB20336.1 hypothetical protein MSWH1_0065 [Methanosarcina sp. WH1]
MQEKAKSIIAIIIVMAVLYCALPLFYETFNYYPPMKEDTPYRRTVQIWNTLTNQRVTLDTEIPLIPVNQLPVYQGKSSSNTLNVSFINSSKSYNKSYTEEIYFLVSDTGVAESRFNLTDGSAALEPKQIVSFKTAGLNDSGNYIIQQVKNRNFVTQKGKLPMFSLGRIRITDVKFVYFNGFDTYPYRYEGQTTYYPAWKVMVETSNYGDEVLMIKAFQ